MGTVPPASQDALQKPVKRAPLKPFKVNAKKNLDIPLPGYVLDKKIAQSKRNVKEIGNRAAGTISLKEKTLAKTTVRRYNQYNG